MVGVFGGTVIRDPRPADGELVEAEHVHHADGGDGGAEELGSLVQDGADEKPSVRAAADRELLLLRVAFLDEELGRRDEVVEDVLFVVERSRLVPFLAVLAAAPEVGLRVDTAELQPDEVADGEPRGRLMLNPP